MWNPILVSLAVVFLTASSLPADSSNRQQGFELKVPTNEVQSSDYNEEDYEDEESESSDLGVDMGSFETNGSENARPIQVVTFSNYSSSKNTYGQPQYYDRHGHREASYTNNSPASYSNENNTAGNSHDYYRKQYSSFYSPESAPNSISYSQGRADADRYDNRDYYRQAGPDGAFNQAAYYEYALNYSRSQYQDSNPEEESKSNVTSHSRPGSSYGYNSTSSSEERSLDDLSSNQSQYYRSSESEWPEDRSEDDPRFRQSQDFNTERNQEGPRQGGYNYSRPYYYGSTFQKNESTQENRDVGNNYLESYSQESDSQKQYYPQEISSERQREYGNLSRPSNSYNDSQDQDRGNEDSRTGTSYYGSYPQESAYNRQTQQSVDKESHYNQPHDRSEIDESDQEVTFDDSRGSEIDYHDSKHARPAQLIDSITPGPRQLVNKPPESPDINFQVEADSYNREIPQNFDNSLIYQPESASDYYQRQQQTDLDSYGQPRQMTTNSYHRRMNQVDEYWREEERQKKVYESQNTYRRDSGNERLENWADCTFDSAGRPINCPPGSPNSWNGNEGLISMHAPLQSVPPVLLPSTKDSSSDPAADKGANAERAAFERANRVQLSAPQWPIRDMDRLGVYPRHPACRLPPKWGVGPEERSAWFYSPTDGRCLWFSYAGHGGNANRFYSRANCESLCVFDNSDLCQNAQCGYPGSRCMLRGDERCKEYAKSSGNDLEIECPPDQPVCRARRAIIPPEYDTSMVPRECNEDVDAGGCLVKNPLIRYYYDARSNTCLAFYFHGCGGNNNRFESMQECMNYCAL